MCEYIGEVYRNENGVITEVIFHKNETEEEG